MTEWGTHMYTHTLLSGCQMAVKDIAYELPPELAIQMPTYRHTVKADFISFPTCKKPLLNEIA